MDNILEMEIENMNDKTVFERLGVEYEERDGLFYPLLSMGTEADIADVGKYGRMWVRYMQTEYPFGYKSLVRFLELNAKAVDVNEYAYKMLEDIENSWLRKHKPMDTSSFVELYRLKTEARTMAEEVILHEVVLQFH